MPGSGKAPGRAQSGGPEPPELGFFETLYGALNRLLNSDARDFHLLVILIFFSRPEKSLQSISLAPRHDVDVEMGHTLANPVIHREERPLSAESLLHGRTEYARLG